MHFETNIEDYSSEINEQNITDLYLLIEGIDKYNNLTWLYTLCFQSTDYYTHTFESIYEDILSSELSFSSVIKTKENTYFLAQKIYEEDIEKIERIIISNRNIIMYDAAISPDTGLTISLDQNNILKVLIDKRTLWEFNVYGK